jgi:hypothetical protein
MRSATHTALLLGPFPPGVMQLTANPDTQMQAVRAHPENMALVKRMIGLEEFVIPERSHGPNTIVRSRSLSRKRRRSDATMRQGLSGHVQHTARRIRRPSRGGAGDLYALVFGRCKTGGEDTGAVGLRERASARRVPPGPS